MSILHVQISEEEKNAYVESSFESRMKLSEWVRFHLNEAAGNELPTKREPSQIDKAAVQAEFMKTQPAALAAQLGVKTGNSFIQEAPRKKVELEADGTPVIHRD